MHILVFVYVSHGQGNALRALARIFDSPPNLEYGATSAVQKHSVLQAVDDIIVSPLYDTKFMCSTLLICSPVNLQRSVDKLNVQ